MINILIVDDSATETQLLKYILEKQSDFRVVGCARNGKEAIEMAGRLKPDLITMDIQMPIMDGFLAIQCIMSQTPTPIVVISGKLQDPEMKATFRALEVGALSVLEKPANITAEDFELSSQRVVDVVRSMAEIKVITRKYPARKIVSLVSSTQAVDDVLKHRHFELVAVGASVGGPQALKQMLSKLPSDFPIPIVVVQHMTRGFMSGFTHWLDENITLHVKSVEQNEILQKGTVYFAVDDQHLEVKRNLEGKLIANLIKGEPVSGFCPSATVLLKSVAKTCHQQAIGVLLTGMGSDGAHGLLEIKKSKGHTFVQDEKSAVVFGMGRVAQSLGAVDKVVEIEQMSDYLIQITQSSKNSTSR